MANAKEDLESLISVNSGQNKGQWLQLDYIFDTYRVKMISNENHELTKRRPINSQAKKKVKIIHASKTEKDRKRCAHQFNL